MSGCGRVAEAVDTPTLSLTLSHWWRQKKNITAIAPMLYKIPIQALIWGVHCSKRFFHWCIACYERTL